MAQQRPLLSEPDAAAYLGVTERHMRDLRYRRELAYVKVGRLVRFEPKVLDRYIAAHTIAAAS